MVSIYIWSIWSILRTPSVLCTFKPGSDHTVSTHNPNASHTNTWSLPVLTD
uniref:Uncharacterized protein n=1 Tax=Anguilla anguilla TaxID=7936 RepID=A0A0E9P6V2_ANGAN